MDSGFGLGGLSKSIAEMTTSKLDYWSPFIIENGVRKSHDIEIRPQSISVDGPIEFHLSADPEKFTDISSLTLRGKVGVRVKNNGVWKPVSEIDPTPDSWGVINNFYQSLFSSVIVKVNDCEIGDISNSSYPYTSYIQTLLGTSASQSGNHILAERGFIKDDPAHMEEANPGRSHAYRERRKNLINNNFVDFNIPIHNDIVTAEKYLPPDTKLSIVIRRSSDEFLIWKTDADTLEYKIVLDDMHLNVKRLEVSPGVLKNHQKELKDAGLLKIKYTQNVMKSFAVPSGSVELKQHNLFFGNRLPNRLYLAFVEQSAYNGDALKNPFNFVTAGMKDAAIVVNGISEPNPPYTFEPDIDERDLYFSFLENTGTSPFEMDSVNVSFEEFKNGYFILPFDRSPTKDNGLYTHKSDAGSITVKVRTRYPIQKNFMVLVFASYDSCLVFAEDKVITEHIY